MTNWFLVIITAIYVFLTYFIFKEAEKNRKDSFLPVLIVRFEGEKMIFENRGKGILTSLEITPANLNIEIGKKFLCTLESREIQIPKIDYCEFSYQDVFCRKIITKVFILEKRFEVIVPRLFIWMN